MRDFVYSYVGTITFSRIQAHYEAGEKLLAFSIIEVGGLTQHRNRRSIRNLMVVEPIPLTMFTRRRELGLIKK